MVQDIADVFGVIEQRGFDKPKAEHFKIKGRIK
jgi:hypothetical protein